MVEPPPAFFLTEHEGLDKHAGESLGVDAGMVHESLVFGGDESVDDKRGNLVVVGVYPVAGVSEISAHFLPVGRIDYGGKLILWIFQLFHRGHIADGPDIYHHQKQ